MLRDLIYPPIVPLLDIEYLLDEAEKEARRYLEESPFDNRTIKICTDARTSGRYTRLVDERHPLLFDEKYLWHTKTIQQIAYIRYWLKSDVMPFDEILSHGYMLALLQHKAFGPDRFKEVVSIVNTRNAQRPRSRNPIADAVIDHFRSEYKPPADQDIKRFGQYIGKRKVLDDLNIEVIEARNKDKRIIYNFKILGSNQLSETIARDGIRKKLNSLANENMN